MAASQRTYRPTRGSSRPNCWRRLKRTSGGILGFRASSPKGSPGARARMENSQPQSPRAGTDEQSTQEIRDTAWPSSVPPDYASRYQWARCHGIPARSHPSRAASCPGRHPMTPGDWHHDIASRAYHSSRNVECGRLTGSSSVALFPEAIILSGTNVEYCVRPVIRLLGNHPAVNRPYASVDQASRGRCCTSECLCRSASTCPDCLDRWKSTPQH